MRTAGSGRRCSTLGRVDEALTSIHDAIRLDPGNGQAHQALARALWVGKGDFAAAIPVFERSIVLNPEAGYSYLQLGLLLSWEGRYAEAERVLRRAVDLQDQFISGQRRPADGRRQRTARVRATTSRAATQMPSASTSAARSSCSRAITRSKNAA